jgi:hypothetical protein
MNGIVLGVVMLISSGGASPVLQTASATVAPTALTINLPDDATPALRLPRDLLNEQSRPVSRFDWSRSAQATAAKRSSRTARIVGVAVGAFGGFMAGGQIGYAVAQKRDVDDDGVSGLRGVVIGAPIGAVVGAVLGYQLTK